MTYFLPFFFFSFSRRLLILRNRTPLFLNIWFSIFTGALSYMLFNNHSSPLSLYLIEERLSLLIMFLWFVRRGGILFSLLLLIKRGISPFHQWFIEVLLNSSRSCLIWALTFHKLPIVCLIRSLNFFNLISLFVFRTITGVFYILSLRNINSIIVLSSSNTLASFFIILCLTPGCGVFFFSLYSLLLWTSINQSKISVNSAFLLFGLIGLPPFIFLQIKWEVLNLLLERNFLQSLLFRFSSGISSIIYIRFIFFIDLELNIRRGASFFFIWAPISILLPTF